MAIDKDHCPGSSLILSPKPEVFPCPNCGKEIEIWTDELKRKCSACNTIVFRELGPSCIDWCKYAKECIGEEAYNRLKGEEQESKEENLEEEGMVIEKKEEEKEKEKAVEDKCYLCGKTSYDRTLFHCFNEGKEKMVCARCIPMLIHG